MELSIRRWEITFLIDAGGQSHSNEASANYGVTITIEQFADTFVAYPTNIEGVIIGQGNTYDEALDNAESAIRFHQESFGTL